MDMVKIRSWVGDITEEQLVAIDCFVGNRMGLFIPAVGQCGYAVTLEHSHPAYSFVLTFDDRLAVGAAGTRIDTVSRGLLVGMSPDFPHHEERRENMARYYAIMIDSELYNEALALQGHPHAPSYRFALEPVRNELLQLLRGFMVQSQFAGKAAAAKIAALETLIVHAVVETMHGSEEPVATAVYERIEIDRAVEFIHGHLGEKLTVEKIAKAVCLSPSHISALFKQSVGKTVMGYLTEVRLQTARLLLLLRDRSIADIAYECGFSSPSHLSQSFKNHYGMTPREVQKSS